MGAVRMRNRVLLVAGLLMVPGAAWADKGKGKAAKPVPTKKAGVTTGAKPEVKPVKTTPPVIKKKAPAPKKATVPKKDTIGPLVKKATTQGMGGWADKAKLRSKKYPWYEHRGYFRFRADLFYNGHLGTVVPTDANSGTSGIRAPLTENLINNNGSNPWPGTGSGADPATSLASANIRFRYQPTIHITSSLRIHATFDVLDNLVLGSTPDFAGNLGRPDVPLVAFSGSQVSPSAGVNGWRDSIRVKEAYADWQPAFLLRVGRMRSHWGLGVLANGGNEIDDDYADYSDRVMLLAKFYGVYVAGIYDMVYSGAITDDPGDFFGQPKDLGEKDDVIQGAISIFQRPLSAKEKQQRHEDLYENLKPQFDWGLYTVFRRQEMDLDTASYDEWQSQGGKTEYPSLLLVPRDAWAVIPDLWLRFQKRLNYHSGIRLELEAVGIFGKVDNVLDSPGGNGSREIQQFGVALEFEYDWNQLKFGLDVGVASGDPAKGFGVEDQHTLGEGEKPNTKLTSFKFDRNYHVDLLLFREVIGTVTNAFYVKPYISYDLFSSHEKALGARLDVLYAQALEPEATPGSDPFLGLEFDVRLFYHELNRFRFDVEAGFLIPGSAFNYVSTTNPDNSREAGFAFTIQTRLSLMF
jgi:uncharacterized protein (TIGR04551 family)